ncbi:hypothetical protein [Aeromicrobium sp.]|uniref:hypothetical protein n=1 Tax=Aeromicrobium sp. TaxID=1871063 RepID=UPI0019CD55BC|nr:hypothetical protein [Aeromicrobium sp.]MBC7630894.1 hypothetical protein [Aeromicrobium sp.]
MSTPSTQARARAALSRLDVPRLASLAATVLVLVGLVALLFEQTRWALAAVLLLQAVVVLTVLEQRGAVAASERRLTYRVDQSSARTLADLSRVRQQVLAALDETRTKD